MTNTNNSQNITKQSPRDIWGKVIIYLREHHAVALHIACGDITDVDFIDDKFIIRTSEDFIYQLLENEDNKKELYSAFNSLGIKDIEIIKKEKTFTKAQIDLKILREKFGDLLEIEGE